MAAKKTTKRKAATRSEIRLPEKLSSFEEGERLVQVARSKPDRGRSLGNAVRMAGGVPSPRPAGISEGEYRLGWDSAGLPMMQVRSTDGVWTAVFLDAPSTPADQEPPRPPNGLTFQFPSDD